MADSGALKKYNNLLTERILDFIPPDDREKVEANPGLRRIRDEAVTREKVVQELIDELQEGYSKAQLKLRSARQAAEDKWKALEQAKSNMTASYAECDRLRAQYLNLQSDYEIWRGRYEAVSRGHHYAVLQAQYQVSQAEAAYKRVWEEHGRVEEDYNQAWMAAETCRTETDAREHYGKLAIEAVRVDHFPQSSIALARIQAVLDAQEEIRQ